MDRLLCASVFFFIAVCVNLVYEINCERPNIVLILTDDQDVILNGLVPMDKVRSLIGAKGATFENAVCNFAMRIIVSNINIQLYVIMCLHKLFSSLPHRHYAVLHVQACFPVDTPTIMALKTTQWKVAVIACTGVPKLRNSLWLPL